MKESTPIPLFKKIKRHDTQNRVRLNLSFNFNQTNLAKKKNLFNYFNYLTKTILLLQQRVVEFLVILLNPAKISETWVPPKEMGCTGSTLEELETL